MNKLTPLFKLKKTSENPGQFEAAREVSQEIGGDWRVIVDQETDDIFLVVEGEL